MIDPRNLPSDVVAQMQRTVEVCGIAFAGSDEKPPPVDVVCNAATLEAAEVLMRHARAWHDELEPPRGKAGVS